MTQHKQVYNGVNVSYHICCRTEHQHYEWDKFTYSRNEIDTTEESIKIILTAITKNCASVQHVAADPIQLTDNKNTICVTVLSLVGLCTHCKFFSSR